MFRLWCKLFDDTNHMLKDTVIINEDAALNRTRKIFDGIRSACYEFDLGEPIWLDCNIETFKLLKDTVIINEDAALNRTRKIFDGIRSACYEFDLGEPIWLDCNIETFKRHSKVRFNQDNFIESIDFSYMEIQVIEED